MGEDTVEIYTLWNRLKQRFSITRSQPKSFILGEIVVPVTSVDFAINTLELDKASTPYASSGHLNLIQVPPGKRWLLHIFGFDRSTGDATVTEMGLKHTIGDHVPIQLFSAVTEKIYYLPHALPLQEGDYLWLNLTQTVNGNMFSWVAYEEMDMEE